MKTNPNDNAYALATTTDTKDYLGLTKREYFAAMLVQGMLANKSYIDDEDCVKCGVEAADMLIAELNKGKK
jgi:hypothetical protein